MTADIPPEVNRLRLHDLFRRHQMRCECLTIYLPHFLKMRRFADLLQNDDLVLRGQHFHVGEHVVK